MVDRRDLTERGARYHRLLVRSFSIALVGWVVVAVVGAFAAG